jgi:hypothetical protein
MPTVPPWLRQPWVHAALLCAVVVAAYAGALLAGFVFDDYALVVFNESIRDLRQVGAFFTNDLWAFADTQVASGYYRPLMTLSLALDWQIAGAEPPLYHLHSLLWHLAAVLALHRLLLGLTRPLPALLGATLFALHPLQSEAVVWVSARNDLMAAALLLGSLMVLRPTDASRWRVGLGAVLALAAVLSKESALLLPLFLLGLDWAEHGRPRGWLRHAVLWAAVGVHLLARSLAGINAGAAPSELGWRILFSQAHHLVATAGGLIAWPWPLSIGRDLQSWSPGTPALVAGLVAATLLPVLLLLAGRGRRLVWVGLSWAAMGAGPAVLAVADKALFGERYLYLALAGLGLALAAALAEADGRARRWQAAGLLLAIPWCLVIHLRMPDWASDVTLWRAALRDTPCSYVEASLGHVHWREDEYAEGAEMFLRALRASPPRLQACPRVMDIAGRLDSPQQALLVSSEALELGCQAPGDRAKHAVYLGMAGRWDQAVEQARLAEAGDSSGRARLVLACGALVSGDCSRYRELRSDWKRGDLEAQMQKLLGIGGHPEIAASIADGSACRPTEEVP